MSLSDDVDLEEFVMAKDDLSGADIKAVCTEAGLLALRERRMRVTKADFTAAREKVLDFVECADLMIDWYSITRYFIGRTRAHRKDCTSNLCTIFLLAFLLSIQRLVAFDMRNCDTHETRVWLCFTGLLSHGNPNDLTDHLHHDGLKPPYLIKIYFYLLSLLFENMFPTFLSLTILISIFVQAAFAATLSITTSPVVLVQVRCHPASISLRADGNLQLFFCRYSVILQR
jgi:hypothetical protein